LKFFGQIIKKTKKNPKKWSLEKNPKKISEKQK